MPAFKVTAPDGNAYTVNAPEGATQEQVLAYAQANYQQAAPAQPRADFSNVQGGVIPGPERTAFQQVNDFGNNMGDAVVHHLGNAVVGGAQLVGHGLGALADATLPQGNVVREAIAGTNANFDAKAAARERDYQAAVPTNTASVVGATIGEVLPFALSGPVKGLQAAGDVVSKVLPAGWQLGRKAISGATQGAIVAGVQPTIGDRGFAGEKAMQVGAGTLLGGGLPLAARGVSELYSLGQHVVAPQVIARNNLARLVGTDPATLAKLDAAGSTVPGVMPTTAQAAPSPSAVAAEKALGNTPYKTQLVERENQNNAARLDVLRRQAGDDTTMQAAREARTAAVQPFIEQHLKPATPLTRWTAAASPLDSVLGNPGRMPSADFDALQKARKVVAQVRGGTLQEDDAVAALQELADTVTTKRAQNAFGEAFSRVDQNMIEPSAVLRAIALTRNTGLGARPAVRKALDDIASTIEQSRNTRGLVPADVLDSIRQNVNDFLVSPTGKRATPQEALGVAPIRDKIVDVIGQHAPGYSDYLAAYAKHSTPINTMAAARAILEPVDNRALNSVGAAPLSLNDINRGLASVDRGRYGVSPQARAELDALQESLKQRGISNSLRFPGSDTAYNVNAQGSLASGLLGPTLGGPTGRARGVAAVAGAALGHSLGGFPGAAAGAGIGAFINKAASVVNSRIMDAYAKGMIEPQQAASMIRAYLKANNSRAPALLKQYPQWKLLVSESPTNLPARRP